MITPTKDLTPAEMGRLGGLARAKALSKRKLAEIGFKGAKARWDAVRAAKARQTARKARKADQNGG